MALCVMAKQKKTAPRVEPSFKKKQTKAKAKPAAKSRSGAKRRTSKTARGKAKSTNLLVRFIKWSSYWCFVLGLWGAIGVGAIFAYYGAKMPNATSWAVPSRPPNIKIVSSDGRTIANRGLTGGQALLLSDMSP